MTNHVHLIISSNTNKLEHIVRDLRKYTSKQIIKSIQDNNSESRKEWMINMFSYTVLITPIVTISVKLIWIIGVLLNMAFSLPLSGPQTIFHLFTACKKQQPAKMQARTPTAKNRILAI
jgi:hypothetical protein